MYRLSKPLLRCRSATGVRTFRPGLESLEDRALLSGGITEFPIPTPGSGPVGITLGPDGNLWFTENANNHIGRMTPAGSMEEFPIITSGGDPWGITTGPDGNLWFTEYFGNMIGRMTTDGSLVEYPIRTPNGNPQGITVGPDGNLWFTEAQGDKIGSITPSGTVTEFPLPVGSRPVGITAGPDGNLWFTEAQRNRIGRMNVAGTLTGEFQVPTANGSPHGIVAGPDGNLWFTEAGGNRIGRISTGGFVVEFPIPTAGSVPEGIAVGPDGSLWFTEAAANQVGRLTPGGRLAEFTGLTSGSAPQGIAVAPGGTLWLSEQNGNQVAKLILDRPLTAGGTNFVATAGTVFNGVVASFTDADPAGGVGSYAALIAWGDGQHSTGTITAAGNGQFFVRGQHSYAAPGMYTLTVAITDQDNGHDVGGNTASAQGFANVVPLGITVAGPNTGVPRRLLSFTGLWNTPGTGDSFTMRWRVTTRGRKSRVVARGAGPRFRFRLGKAGAYVLSLSVTDQETGTGTTVSRIFLVHGKAEQG
jgi:streptogramin lyase